MAHDRLTISTAIINILSCSTNLPVQQLIKQILATPGSDNDKIRIFSNNATEEAKIRKVMIGLLQKKILKAVADLNCLELCLNLSHSPRARSFIRKVEQLNSM